MSAIFGETLTFKQENGPDVPLVVFGDEHYARYETEDGYTVIYDNDRGLYYYATLVDGSFVCGGVPISKPPPPETPPHLKESNAVRHAKVAAKVALRTPPDEPH